MDMDYTNAKVPEPDEKHCDIYDSEEWKLYESMVKEIKLTPNDTLDKGLSASKTYHTTK
jgi:hypothetical protein